MGMTMEISVFGISFTIGNQNKISQRSPVNVHDNNNHTPLFLAVLANNIEIARFLIEKCNAAPKKSDGTPPPYLIVAVQNRNKYMVDLLLKSLSSLNDRKILFEKAIEKEAQDKVGEGVGEGDDLPPGRPEGVQNGAFVFQF